jgi:hypothetical protein
MEIELAPEGESTDQQADSPRRHAMKSKIALRTRAVRPRQPPKKEPPPRHSTARALLKHLGTWVGDDAQKVLRELRASRSEAEF